MKATVSALLQLTSRNASSVVVSMDMPATSVSRLAMLARSLVTCSEVIFLTLKSWASMQDFISSSVTGE